MSLAYLIWDPNPSMFRFDLPVLNRPILWYGFLFALGFFVGYCVGIYLLRRYFLMKGEFLKEDVLSWPDLVHTLYVGKGEVVKKILVKLPTASQKWCSAWKVGREIPEEEKTAIVAAMNKVVHDPAPAFDVRLSPFSRRLSFFAAKRGRKEAVRFLQVEEELKASLSTIKRRATKKAEQLTFYVILGALVGARLGDVLFYQSWKEIIRHPSSIFAVWQGGLASHGGAIGILIALWIYAVRHKIRFWTVVDFTVIPTAIAAVFIRIGNFMNQEILGTPSDLPWAVLFLHPADSGAIVPRHPAQLYEAIFYLCSFAILMLYWQKREPFRFPGKTTGLFLVLIFGFRFVVEWIKVEQSAHLSAGALLTMGQILSIPFIALGLYLFFRKNTA